MKFKFPFFKIFTNPERVVASGREIELISSNVKLKQAVQRTRRDRDEWRAKFEEMEKRWKEMKKRKDELRVEKLELEAELSDTLALLNSEQELKRSVARDDAQ